MKPPKYILKRVHRSRDSKEFQESCKKCHFLIHPGCGKENGHPCKMGEYYILNPDYQTVSQRIRKLDVLMVPVFHEGKEYVPVSVDDVRALLKSLEEEENGNS